MSIAAIFTGAVALALAILGVALGGIDPVPQDQAFGNRLLPAALVLVIISVFSPNAIFRTQNAARVRQVLSSPSAAMPTWSTSTVTFDAILIGGLLAGIYFDGPLAFAMFGLAFIARIAYQSKRHITQDPNARYHSVISAWSAAATATVAFLIVKPLIVSIDDPAPVAPLILAAIVATYFGLALNSIQRWVDGDHINWAFARDSADPRRLIVASLSALIAWVVSYTGIAVDAALNNGDTTAGIVAGLAVYLMALMSLWCTSIWMWKADASRTMTIWTRHQADVTRRLADASLDPDLAARAALRVTTRMAISVFGATRALTVVNDGHKPQTSVFIGVDRYANAPAPDPGSMLSLPHLTMSVYPMPDDPNTSTITVAGWLWPGWVMTRSPTIISQFTDLAAHTLLTPVIAAQDERRSAAFDDMYTSRSRWPSWQAFAEAVHRMREQVDASPQSTSLLIGVYAIDDFGALSGGKFEQVAIAQIMRLAFGSKDFAGHDAFVAYEHPGRIWVALSGGPIVRNGIQLLRDLQQSINNHGSIPSAKLDIDVHVSVSFGYGAHQVDDFTFEGLTTVAQERLLSDQAARDPFTIDNLFTYDFSPADIIDAPDTPVTTVDLLALMAADRMAQMSDGGRRFSTEIFPITRIDSGHVTAVSAAVCWNRTVGSVDASSPEAFRLLVSRRMDVAAEAADVILTDVKGLLAEAARDGEETIPVMAWMPSVLLAPDAGEFSLPNLVTPFLNRAECARTIILIDTIPEGSGQAISLLADRGVHIAVTAGAAAADPNDLYGWTRWGIVFPEHIVDGPTGVDSLTIQQTASAVANHNTQLIAVTRSTDDARDLKRNNVQLLLNPRDSFRLTEDNSLRDHIGG